MTGPLAQPLRGASVLVVEDNFVLADAMKSFLETIGCLVVGPAPDIESALALVESSTLDAAILDIDLQGENCHAIARKLRDELCPMLFTTGYNESILPQEFREHPLLTKPVDACQLEEILISLIREARGTHE